MHRIICCAALVALLGSGRLEANVIVTDAYHDANVYDGFTGLASDQYTTSTAPSLNADLFPSISDGSARTQLNRTATALDVVLTHQRPSSLYSFAQSSGWDVFRVDVLTPYTISGRYSMTGAGTISLAAQLYDVTSDAYLFRNGQQSIKTSALPNQLFRLGSQAGDYSYREGFLTGTLQPGDEYQFTYNAYINNYPDDFGSASASGHISLSFTSSLPEPSTLTTLITSSVVGALGMVISRWRRRRAA
jgi:hypothetical protein